MPQFSRALDIYQGYNFKQEAQTAVGYITAMSVGGTALSADQSVSIPNVGGGASAASVVAVLSHVYWGTGATDAVYFSGQISYQNRQRLADAIDKGTAGSVEFTFAVHEYDPGDQSPSYFGSFSGHKLHGAVEKNGDDLNLSLADNPSTEVQSPQNYSFQMGLKPQAEETITICVSKTAKIPKKWGKK